MSVTRADKERLNDSRLKIQSIHRALHSVQSTEVPDLNDIENCLESAEKSIDKALHAADAADV